MFKKLKLKFIITLTILFSTIIIGIFSAVYISTKINGERMIFSKLAEAIGRVKFKEDGVLDIKNGPYDNVKFALHESRSNKLYYSNEERMDKEAINALVNRAYELKSGKGYLLYDNHYFAFTSKITPRGVLFAFEDATFYYNSLDKLMITLIFVAIAALIAVYFVSIYISKKAIEPVEEVYNAQRRFIADASHELKTPLAIINTNLEVMKNNEDSKWINYILFQTERMGNLITNLLHLAKMDNNEVIGIKGEFNLSDAVMNQLLSFEAIIYEEGLSLDTNIEDNIEFFGDKERINQLVGILVDNGIKYSDRNKEIEVSLKKKKNKVNLSVTNHGEEIPKEDLEKIFERFYRVDKSRAREMGGYGLGLSIAKAIVSEYKGKIAVSSENRKTTFYVELECK